MNLTLYFLFFFTLLVNLSLLIVIVSTQYRPIIATYPYYPGGGFGGASISPYFNPYFSPGASIVGYPSAIYPSAVGAASIYNPYALTGFPGGGYYFHHHHHSSHHG